jgi:1-acyl-sn-glycerol-3-phosphate acyltransferase
MRPAMSRGINLATRLSGARMRCEGLENVDPKRNYIVVSNHQSLLDISQASEYLAALEPRYVSKVELARGVPGVSYNLRHGGSACIDRRDPKQAHAAIEELGRRVREDGYTVVIFPEGTRSKNGRMREWKTGGLRTLLRCAPGVPVLPVTTSGGSLLFKRNTKPLVRGVPLVFRIHPPMTPPDAADDAAFDEFVRRLAATIEGGLPPDPMG